MDDAFQELARRKRKLLVPMMMAFFVFYFGLPFSLAFFHDVMNRPSPVMHITWGWLYAFAQIPFTWILVGIYYHKMKKFDSQLKEVVQKVR